MTTKTISNVIKIKMPIKTHKLFCDHNFSFTGTLSSAKKKSKKLVIKDLSE